MAISVTSSAPYSSPAKSLNNSSPGLAPFSSLSYHALYAESNTDDPDLLKEYGADAAFKTQVSRIYIGFDAEILAFQAYLATSVCDLAKVYTEFSSSCFPVQTDSTAADVAADSYLDSSNSQKADND
ncbi:MAG: hypothetical protein EZS28_042333 [Streblomastix strix]|uniref:Uncharacterized protein n=1 Tax=Streblomastix strix TaxID=222440 RepID=A0A5J4TVS8_9EUKA|nr:MAG: hypothetical protein EZS28_042333 [Streblomastix strix]